MIHYHGTPMTPNDACVAALSGRHAMVSFAHAQDLEIVQEVCQSFAVDNGAFSAWVSGKPIEDWTPYYEWVETEAQAPGLDFALIPDVIDGDEPANDALVAQWPYSKAIGCPVWHLHESLSRLEQLASSWPRVALGSSGPWSDPGTPAWWRRMAEAMGVLCREDGRPWVKIHGLRMLDVEIVSRVPFSSADSCNVAKNIGLDSRWSGTYQPPTKTGSATPQPHRPTQAHGQRRPPAPSGTRLPWPRKEGADVTDETATETPSTPPAVLARPCEVRVMPLREAKLRPCGKGGTRWVRGKWRCERHRRRGR